MYTRKYAKYAAVRLICVRNVISVCGPAAVGICSYEGTVCR